MPQAEEMFKSAVKIDEKDLKARFALAEFYLRSGKKDLAEREYVEATRIAPAGCEDLYGAGKFPRRRQ